MRLTTNSAITFPFGATSYPYSKSNPHAGLDSGYNPNDPYLYAPEDGFVESAGYLGACGNHIQLSNTLRGGTKHRICHAASLFVQRGQYVKEGQRIGIVGETGYAFGKHSHHVMWIKGKRVNPANYITTTTKGGSMSSRTTITQVFKGMLNRSPDAGALKTYAKVSDAVLVKSVYESGERKRLLEREKAFEAKANQAIKSMSSLQASINQLKTRPTKQELQEAVQSVEVKLQDAKEQLAKKDQELAKIDEKIEEVKRQPDVVAQTINIGFTESLMSFITKLFRR